MGTKLLKCALTTQSITLFLTLITNGLSNNIFFALFWASTIISLITILSMKKWELEEWFGFAAITFSMVGGVLFAIRVLDREVFVIILIAILLFMAGTAQHRKLCIMKGESCGPCCQRRKKRLAKSKQAPQVIIVEEKIELPQKKTATQQTKSEESMKKGKKKATKKTSSKKKTTKKKTSQSRKK